MSILQKKGSQACCIIIGLVQEDRMEEEKRERSGVGECAVQSRLSQLNQNKSKHEYPGSTCRHTANPRTPETLDRQFDRLGFSRGFVL